MIPKTFHASLKIQINPWKTSEFTGNSIFGDSETIQDNLNGSVEHQPQIHAEFPGKVHWRETFSRFCDSGLIATAPQVVRAHCMSPDPVQKCVAMNATVAAGMNKALIEILASRPLPQRLRE